MMKIARFWSEAQQVMGRAAGAATVDADGLQAFGSEQDGGEAPKTSRAKRRSPMELLAALRIQPRVAWWTAAIVLILGVTAASVWAYQRRAAARTVDFGHLTIDTTPAGLDVTIAGERRGQTPLTLDLPPGQYSVEIGAGNQRRLIQATVTSGGSFVQRVELAPTVATGTLHIETEPSGIPVAVDGTERGRSPVTISQLEPGEHQVIAAGSQRTRKTVTVRANETVSLILSDLPDARTSPAIGWLTVKSSIPLEVREDGKVIGTTGMERVMLPAGNHTLEFVNEAVEYRVSRKTSIVAGNTARIAVEVPQGTLSINAQPWADVWLDGRSLGATPIGNISTTIGTHEVVFRHPELGERRVSVSVGTKTPARLGIDMRGK